MIPTNDQGFWNIVMGTGVAAGGALAGWFAKHRSHTDQQVTQRDDLIKIINDQLVKPLSDRLENAEADVEKLRARLEKAEARNSGLAGYVYKLLAVLRRNHLETEIPEPPEGIQL